ncbi:MAG: hypothetical protein IH840_00970 [Candidatus Heimdallarchaeota archaeon]|nr:hypothetical protein [Candidatus Heimdallarchaeota archaeon]
MEDELPEPKPLGPTKEELVDFHPHLKDHVDLGIIGPIVKWTLLIAVLLISPIILLDISRL